jgi:hypothetical protein
MFIARVRPGMARLVPRVAVTDEFSLLQEDPDPLPKANQTE